MKHKIWNVMLAALMVIAIICLAFGVAAFASVQKAGADGKSAYATWLENGNEGTEDDFLNWLKGEKGESGTDGNDGINGSDGTNGIDGESAFDIWKEKYGDDSSTEDDFLNWLKGENGTDGKDGKDGQDGADGKDGKDGQNGSDGKDGQDGKDGADGTSAFEIWKEKYGNDSSTEEEFLNWLKGEKGDKGEDGKDGQDGKDGVDGKDGQNGSDGKDGQDGKDGADGKSAFEIWKDKHGDDSSTEDDFLEWLKGEKGENGTDGKDGQDGKDGADGKDGKDGQNGSDGKDGQDGKDGKDGADGKSAFEIWKDKYGDDSSTEEEFLEWLKGEDGKDATACDHTYSDWSTELKPTCTSIGYDIRTCTKCGAKDYEFSEATEHIWSEGVVIVPACEKVGVSLYICTVCETTSATQVPMTGHKFDDGICTECGKSATDTGLVFTYKTTYYAVTGYTGLGKIVIIPEKWNGLPVTSIDSSAFGGCASLTEIIIPDSVMSIGASAFRGCINLTAILIPDSVTSIGESAFNGCINLTEIIIPDSVTSIGESIFSGCSNLKSLTTPFIGTERKTTSSTRQYPLGYMFGTTEYSGSAAVSQTYYTINNIIPADQKNYRTTTFYIPESLTEITITDSQILENAFQNCTMLQIVTIGKGVNVIDRNAFSGCTSLTTAIFENTTGWTASVAILSSDDLANPETAAKYLTDTYCRSSWKRA